MSECCIVCGKATEEFVEEIWDDRYGHPGRFSIRSCPDCGQMATSPALTEDDLPNLYSTYYPRREIDYVGLERDSEKVARAAAPLRRFLEGTDNQGHYFAQRGQKVLDIGCGSCLSLLEMRRLGIDAYGVEADPNVRTIAGRYDLRVHIGSFQDTPFPDEQFDLIVLNQVIEHVPEPAVLLKLAKTRLAPGGSLIVAVPNAKSLARKLSGRRWINWHVPYHQHHFNKTSFQRLARSQGYRIDWSRTITPTVWSLLQLAASFRTAPSPSAPSSLWTGASTKMAVRRPNLIARIIKHGVKLTALLTLGVANRLIDAAGYGDSILFKISPIR